MDLTYFFFRGLHGRVLRPIILLISATLALPAIVTATGNAPVTWTTSGPISGDSDVLNTGTTVGAFSIRGTSSASATVNGVTFMPFNFSNGGGGEGMTTTVGNFSLESPGDITVGFFSSAATPFSSLSSTYQTLLSNGVVLGDTTMTLTMNGLTSGQSYTFEWWSNDANLSRPNQVTQATATNSVTISDNTNQTNGSPGSYAVGTFTANSTSEMITFAPGLSNDYPVINGFQLRTNAVPELSSGILLAFGASAFLGGRRHRRA